ncbi:toll/interleukin-1 receptor domain-containing protein [Microbispora sp. KK1-11]|uniref:toll/interleukin-1 receptor domain-containing protein n=1 Tax=Microbispora sp. KK1-11 TaxID=2053005 RepID=UPI00115A858D|nr:toll/interleukin-1 receptor domain-containing protein [Microbispora sp. KK1-11]TQS22492.1 toll/interleukin-1 receptor domain-containing protein [Microbispora sp. KK1-11]
MPTVFINYRTGDGDKTAILIEQELSKIMGGKEQIFRATRSIRPGQRFPEELLGNVRRATVILAVIGPSWTSSAKLRDKDDWVRRELREAHTLGIPVIPVLEGPGARRLDPAELPLELKWLTEVQSERLNLENLEADLGRLFTRLSEWIPSLRSVTRQTSGPAADTAAPGSLRNSAGTMYGPAIQGRDVTTGDITTGDVMTGEIRTYIRDNRGTAHTGDGNIYNQQFSGNGAAFVAGDNHGGIGHRFDGVREDDKEDGH